MVAMVRRHLPNSCRSPILTRSTLSTLAARKEDAVAEAEQKIDRILPRRNGRALLLLTLVLVFGVEAKGDLSPRELFKPPSDPLSWESSECDDPTLDEPAWHVCLYRTG